MTESAVITGLGLHGAFGGLAETWQALAAGQSALKEWRPQGIGEVAAVPAAPAAELSLEGLLRDRKLQKYMNPAAELAVASAGRALQDAGELSEAALAETALFISTGLIAFDLAEVTAALKASARDGVLDLALLGERGLKACNPLLPFKLLLNMPLGLSSIAYGVGGPNFVGYPDASQAGVALETALRGVRTGRFPRALVGAGARGLGLVPMATARRLGRVAGSVEHADPRSEGHDGVALADAGACLLVESAPSARGRGARVHAALEHVTCLFSSHGQTPSDARELLAELGSANAVLLGGLQARPEVEAFCRAVRDSLPGAAAYSLDGLLGYPSAAALPQLVALACGLFAGHRFPEAAALDAGREEPMERVLVLCADGDGGLVEVRLARAGEGER